VDRALGAAAAETIARACGRATAQRLALIAPGDRDDVAALKRAGFTGYLFKPVRGTSLAARFDAAHAGFEHCEDGHAHRAPSIADNGRAILIAGENDISALLARALLSKLGYRSSIATTGNDVVESWLSARCRRSL
jgi:CheY-like chemotaxis protein